MSWRLVMLGFLAAYATGAACAGIVRLSGLWHGGGWESAVLVAAQRTVNSGLDIVMLSLPWFGTNYTLAPVVALAGTWLWRRRLYAASLHLLTVQAGAWLLNPALKLTFPRERPPLFEARGQFALPAFPSGHAIASVGVMLTAAYLLHRYRRITWGYWLAGVVIVVIVWSRVYLSVHWPSDVIAGIAVGTVWLIFTLRAFRHVHPV